MVVWSNVPGQLTGVITSAQYSRGIWFQAMPLCIIAITSVVEETTILISSKAWVLASLQAHLAWSAPTNILTKKIRNANVHQSYAAGVMKVGSKLDKKPYWYQVLFLLGEGAQQKDAFLTMVNWGFHMISDEDQLYARIVELDEI